MHETRLVHFTHPMPDLRVDRVSLKQELVAHVPTFASAAGVPNTGRQQWYAGSFEACAAVDRWLSVRAIVEQLSIAPDFVTIFKTHAGRMSNSHCDIGRFGAINIDFEPNHQSFVLWQRAVDGPIIGMHRCTHDARLFNPRIPHMVVNDTSEDRYTLSLYYVETTYRALQTLYMQGKLVN